MLVGRQVLQRGLLPATPRGSKFLNKGRLQLLPPHPILCRLPPWGDYFLQELFCLQHRIEAGGVSQPARLALFSAPPLLVSPSQHKPCVPVMSRGLSLSLSLPLSLSLYIYIYAFIWPLIVSCSYRGFISSPPGSFSRIDLQQGLQQF